MNKMKKLVAALLFATITTPALAAVTDNQVFAYAEANYATLFSGASQSGVYQQYNYRYYPATKNYLAVDSAKVIHILGPASNGNIQSVGPVSAFEGLITTWEAKQGGTGGATTTPVAGLMGGVKQGVPLTLTPFIVSTLAGYGSTNWADGTGAAASFNGLGGITTDGSNLYVTSASTIRKIVIATGVVTTLAGNNGYGKTYGTGEAASLGALRGITTDGSNLYVADRNIHKIRKIEIATGVVTTVAGSGKSGSADGIGAAAAFNLPHGITTDGSNLYVADMDNNKIRKIVIATGVVTTFAGGGKGYSTDGTGIASSFAGPSGITSDGSNLYVTDTYSSKIRKIVIASGVVTTLAGPDSAACAAYGRGCPPGAVDGTGTAARFYEPEGITTDGSNLYVADTRNSTIRKIVIATGVVTTLAGSGKNGTFADGTGTAATFYGPNGITSDGNSLYVADSYKIRKLGASVVSLSPPVETAGGSTGTAGGTTGGSTNSGTAKGNVCVATTQFQGMTMATGCYINLGASFNCTNSGINGTGYSTPLPGATITVAYANACPANPTMTIDMKGK